MSKKLEPEILSKQINKLAALENRIKKSMVSKDEIIASIREVNDKLIQIEDWISVERKKYDEKKL